MKNRPKPIAYKFSRKENKVYMYWREVRNSLTIGWNCWSFSGLISEEEIKEVVAYLKKQNADTLDTLNFDEASQENGSDIFRSLAGGGGNDDVDDDLYEDARIAVIEAGKASTSYIQRKLRVGYSRAARLMDLLEEKGVIGPADGSRPREIIGNGSGDDDNASQEENTEDPRF